MEKPDKKIIPGCFRPLTEGETRILFMRHGAHKNNVLSPGAIAQAIATGEALKASRVDILVAYSSPSPRALATNLHTQSGYGKMVYVHTNTSLSDLALEDAEHLGTLKERVETKGLKWGDAGIAEVAYDSAEPFIEVIQRRANDGALALGEIRDEVNGKTALVTSHGVARIEAVLQHLKYEPIHKPERLVAECQIIELIFQPNGLLVEENWLEPVPVPVIPAP